MPRCLAKFHACAVCLKNCMLPNSKRSRLRCQNDSNPSDVHMDTWNTHRVWICIVLTVIYRYFAWYISVRRCIERSLKSTIQICCLIPLDVRTMLHRLSLHIQASAKFVGLASCGDANPVICGKLNPQEDKIYDVHKSHSLEAECCKTRFLIHSHLNAFWLM